MPRQDAYFRSLVPCVRLVSEESSGALTICPSIRSSPASIHPCTHLTTFHPSTWE